MKERVAGERAMKPISSIVGVILSGGASERMGSPKALLAFPDGTTLLARQTQLLREAGCARIVAVVGAHADEIQSSCRDLDVLWVVNDRWELGQFSSLQTGLAAAFHGGCDGAIILPVDVAGVARATVEAIIETALRNPHLEAVIPEFDGRGGHPVFLSAALCQELQGFDPANLNARLDAILKKTPDIIRIPVNDPCVVRNVNTRETWDPPV